MIESGTKLPCLVRIGEGSGRSYGVAVEQVVPCHARVVSPGQPNGVRFPLDMLTAIKSLPAELDGDRKFKINAMLSAAEKNGTATVKEPRPEDFELLRKQGRPRNQKTGAKAGPNPLPIMPEAELLRDADEIFKSRAVPKDIGARLLEIREANKASQQHLAERTMTTDDMVSVVEKRGGRGGAASKLAAYLRWFDRNLAMQAGAKGKFDGATVPFDVDVIDDDDPYTDDEGEEHAPPEKPTLTTISRAKETGIIWQKNEMPLPAGSTSKVVMVDEGPPMPAVVKAEADALLTCAPREGLVENVTMDPGGVEVPISGFSEMHVGHTDGPGEEHEEEITDPSTGMKLRIKYTADCPIAFRFKTGGVIIQEMKPVALASYVAHLRKRLADAKKYVAAAENDLAGLREECRLVEEMIKNAVVFMEG